MKASPADRDMGPLLNVSPQLNVGTLDYRALEIVMGDASFGPKIDAFSLGMVLADVAGFAFIHQTARGYSLRSHT